jgi:membrane protein
MAIVMPHAAMRTVLDTFHETTAPTTTGKLTFGLVFSIWSASVGFSAIQNTLNVVYQIKETRSYFAARISAIGPTLLLIGLVTLTFGCAARCGPFGKDCLPVHIHHLIAIVCACSARALG